MSRIANEFDVVVMVYAKKQDGQIVDGFTSHPAPQNVEDRVNTFRRIGSDSIIPRNGLNFGKDKSAWLNNCKTKGWTIFVRPSHRDPVQVWPKM